LERLWWEKGCAPSNQERESFWEWWREENSTGEVGRPTSHVSCKQTHQLAGAAAHIQQAGEGNLAKAAVEGKLQGGREGKTHFPREL
jgi:hypothetical protein